MFPARVISPINPGKYSLPVFVTCGADKDQNQQISLAYIIYADTKAVRSYSGIKN